MTECNEQDSDNVQPKAYSIRLEACPKDPQIQGAARGEVARMDAYCFPWDDPVRLDGTFWWVARDKQNKEAVAYAGLRIQGYGIAYLCRAGVMSEHRGKQIQRKLIGARVRYARRLEQRIAITDTTVDNLASANNLIRSGFTLYYPEYQWAGSTALYWWLTL